MRGGVSRDGTRTAAPPVALPRLLRTRLLRGIGDCQVVFLSAGAGWGKTTAARELLGKDGPAYVPLGLRPLPASFPRRRLVVLDNFQALDDSPAGERFAALLRKAPPTQRFVLLSRGPLPEYLSPREANGGLLRLGRDDLALDGDALARLARGYGLSPEGADPRRLARATGGNPVAAGYLLSALAAGRPFRRETEEAAAARVGEYLDSALFRRLTDSARRVLAVAALFPVLPPGLAEALTGDGTCGETLEALWRTTGLLARETEGFSLCDDGFTRPFLRRKAAELFSPGQVRGLHRAGGRWYEETGDRERALFHYRQGDSREDLVRVLADSARRRPDGGDVPGEYFDLLTREEALGSPDLMAAMSMRRSAALQVEEAEEWYGALKARLAHGGDPRTRGLLAWLDVALPHRDSGALARSFPAVAATLAAEETALPPLPVTGGLPSVLRGWRDLSVWAARDGGIPAAAEAALGRSGVGLCLLAETERLLEQGGDVSPRLPALVSLRRTLRADGTPEMEFVAVALQVRALCAAGALTGAEELLGEFRREMEAGQGAHLLPNIDAMLCRLALLGDDDRAEVWLAEQAPEEGRFLPAERYRCLTKARCYLRRGEYLPALLLLSRVLDDARRSGRDLDCLEALLLTAICRFRAGGEDWRDYFRQAVALGGRYGYVAVFAREGAALLPLLEQYAADGTEGDYWRRVRSAAIVQAGYYGGYLRPPGALAKRLTDAEDLTLRLVCQGKTNAEIAGLLGVKVSTVKTHLRSVYQKLEVSTRAQAQAAARQLHPCR